MTDNFILDPRVTEFLKHLETGLAQAGLDFKSFNPRYVYLKDEGKNEDTNGCIFSQVINPKDFVNTVCVTPDGVSFPEPNKSKLPFSFDQPPSLLAVLFLVSMIKGEIIDPPSCPYCEEANEE